MIAHFHPSVFPSLAYGGEKYATQHGPTVVGVIGDSSIVLKLSTATVINLRSKQVTAMSEIPFVEWSAMPTIEDSGFLNFYEDCTYSFCRFDLGNMMLTKG